MKTVSFRSSHLDLLSLLFILSSIIAIFYKTIFQGKSISRLALLAEWDSLYSHLSTGASSLYDPSLIQLFLPNYFFIARTFAKGIVPLWNPYSGAGYPLIGDIQTSVFSPFHLALDVFPSSYCYNLCLITELAIAGTAAYFLGRQLRLGRPASIFGALSFIFCPFNLWYLELDTGSATCLFPLVFALFTRSAFALTAPSAVLAGLSAAILIMSGHPESAFFGIFFASLLMLGLIWTSQKNTPLIKLFCFAKQLSIAALATICFSAPVLFPFVEFLLNSETYKYVSVCSAHIPWQGVLFNLLNPGVGAASPFLGITALLAIPFSFAATKGNENRSCCAKSLWWIALICFLLITQLGPLESFFCTAPFTAIITRYAMPVLLLILAFLSAFGLEEIFPVKAQISKKKLACLFFAAIFILLSSYLLRTNKDWLSASNFDLMLTSTAFNLSAWKRDIWCTIPFLILAFLAYRYTALSRTLLFAGCIITLMVSEVGVSKDSLPIRSGFDYPVVAPLDSIKDDSYRCISCGSHLFKPGSNINYGINQLQVHNPLFPARFLTFIKETGAHVDLFNQEFGLQVSPLLSLASVKYIVSMNPVYFDSTPETTESTDTAVKEHPISFGKGLRLTAASFHYDASGAAGTGSLFWQLSSDFASYASPTYSFVLFDDNNRAVWYSDQVKIENTAQGQKYCIPISTNILRLPASLKLGLQIFDNNHPAFLKAESSNLPSIENCLILSKFTTKAPNIATEKPLCLIKETANHIRLYKNNLALPRAYVVQQALFTSSAAESLRAIKSSKFDAQKETVIEDPTVPDIERISLSPDKEAAIIPVQLHQITPNKIELTLDGNTDGYLVLTDVFYPGWNAFAEGKKRDILRANYLFRAIRVSKGERTVVFNYEPLSFALGCLILVCFTGTVVALFLGRKIKVRS